MTEEQVDYQLGASDVDQTAVDDGEFIPFQMETRVVFRRLAEDIYPSPRAGIREAITNAITATTKVESNNYEPIINISVDAERSRPQLIIEDNGIGMTMQTIRDVVSYIGRSTVRDDNTKSGQFGMGFLALFSLCGSDGGFIMHTNSRKEHGEPISGVWKDGGFSRFEEPIIDDTMKGTRFEIILKDEITVDDIREWVESVAQWSRVPILYEDKKEDNVHSEEFGVSKIDSLVKEDELYITLDTEYYTIVCSNNLEDTPTILLDVLIDRNYSDIPKLPFDDLAIRLKTEHPVALTGDFEGKMVVSNIEYEKLPSKRKRLYVPERKINDDTPITPAPTGTREKLNANKQFWEHISNECNQEYIKQSKNIMKKIENQSISSLVLTDFEFLCDSLFLKLDDYDRFKSFMQSRYNDIYSDELAQKIYALLQNVQLSRYNPRNEHMQNEDKKVYEIICEESDNIFMYINNVNHEKAMRIYASQKPHTFVKIENSNWYEFYEDILSWNKLKDVTEDHPICESINGKDINEIITNKNETDNSTSSQITIYTKAKKESICIDDIPDKIITEGREYMLEIANQKINNLIIFPSNLDYNISEYNWLVCEKFALVRTQNQDITNELKNIPVSTTIDEFINKSQDTKLKTSNGIKKAKEIDFDNSIIHIVPNELHNLISSQENCMKMFKLLDENKFHSISVPSKKEYVTIKESDLYNILPLVKRAIIMNTDKNMLPMDDFIEGPNIGQCKLYLSAFEERNTDIIQEFDREIFAEKSLSDSKLSVLSLLKQINNSDIELAEVNL